MFKRKGWAEGEVVLAGGGAWVFFFFFLPEKGGLDLRSEAE